MAAAGFGPLAPAAGRWKSEACLKYVSDRRPPSQMAAVMQKMARLGSQDVRYQRMQVCHQRCTH